MCKDLGNNNYECAGNCANGSVWGTGLYTGDSNPYTAAKHMGIVPGKFRKVIAPGFSNYLSTSMNGITTANYGAYGSSYILVSVSGAVSACNCTGGVSNEALDAVKNQIKTHSENLANSIKNQMTVFQEQTKKSHLLMVEELKNSNQKMSEKETKIILNAIQKDSSLCIICMERERSRVLFPCCHAVYCEECVKVIRQSECSVCKAKPTGDMRIIL